MSETSSISGVIADPSCPSQRWVMSWWTWTSMSTRTCRSNVVNIAGEEQQGDGFSFLPTQSHPANLFTLRAIARRV